MSSTCCELEVGVAKQRDVLVLELDGGGRALEVEARADFLGGVVHGVFHFNEVGFADGVKRGHGSVRDNSSAALGCPMRQFSHDREQNVPCSPTTPSASWRGPHAGARGSEADLLGCWPTRRWRREPKFILGGGSNMVLTGDVRSRWCSRSKSWAAAW
jgi:hypothetical protein